MRTDTRYRAFRKRQVAEAYTREQAAEKKVE
jgi:hypothetical protein